MRREPFSSMKCFHAGGQAKSWLAESKELKILDGGQKLTSTGQIKPFVEITGKNYERQQRVKKMLGSLGYYTLFRTS